MKKGIRMMAEKLYSLPFNKRIKHYLVLAVLGISGTLMILASFFSAFLMTQKFRDLTESNIVSVSEGVSNVIEQYGETLKSIIPDENIQSYLKEEKKESTILKSRKTLKIISIMKKDINFIALWKNKNNYIYRGVAINKSHFAENYEEDLRESMLWNGGDLRVRYGNTYFTQDMYTISIYQPVYDMNVIGKKIGMLCVNVDSSALDILNSSTIGNSKLEFYIVNDKGDVVFSKNRKKIGSNINIKIKEQNDCGVKGKIFFGYNKIKQSSLYVVGIVNNESLIEYSILSLSIILLAFLIIIVIVIVLISWGIKKTYEPMQTLVQYMDMVSEGNLDVRISKKEYGADFQKVQDGFNRMLINIQGLLEQIKMKQKESEQIKLNVLQAQIKPHFLYNTLDCIHWQAAANGDKEVSLLVKALANYYRLSLSRGKDKITLKEELECARNYIVLQNLRYGENIRLNINIKEEWLNLEIPKMTLQPLLENVVYHGLENLDEEKEGRITIFLRPAEDGVMLYVEDNGTGMQEEEIIEMNHKISIFDENFGYGVRNVNRRIELLYGEAYGLTYMQNNEGGVTVQIHLPEVKREI